MPCRARVAAGNTGDVGWLVAERRVCPPLQPFVHAMQGYVERSPDWLARRELPAPQCVVILDLGAPIEVFAEGPDAAPTRFPGGFVAGLDDRFTLTRYRGEQRGIQLNLTPIGTRLLFGVPMRELTRRVIGLCELWPGERSIGDELRDLPSWDARFDRLEARLCQRLRHASAHTRMMAWAFARVLETGGRVPAADVANTLGYSHKHTIDLFHEHIGMTPKALARLVRFDRLTSALRRSPPRPWADLAIELGFTDQAHLAREVRRFSGLTPSALRTVLGAPSQPESPG